MKWKKIWSAAMGLCMILGVTAPAVPSYAGVQQEALAAEQKDTSAVRQVFNFNTDWKYKKGDISGADKEEFGDGKWGYVNLPHSTTFYTAENKEAYLGISWYRKHFTVDRAMQGKKLYLTLEAAMQKAEIYMNGEPVTMHEGGYIPFVLDVSDLVRYGDENVIAVKIDSRSSTSFAPGKDKPDFQYFGGIYGNAYLTVTDPIHITDAVEAGVTAGGGVFVTFPEVSETEALLHVKTHLENESGQKETVTLLTELLDQNNRTVVSEEAETTLAAGAGESMEQSVEVANPRLWAPDTPELYTLRSTVKVNGAIRDVTETSCGIRKVEWKRDGLYINGKKTKTQGVNLHAETYMLGNAMPDNAIEEEVRRVKEYGFDIIRMAHYPHRQAYYDACDKYGVMIAECPSGWQYYNDSEAFKESTYRELRTDIRHKRNHPSIVVWESSLNESGYTNAWAQEMNRIVKEEYPADGCVYAYTAGCIQWDAWDIGLSTPQAGMFRSYGYGAKNPAYADKPMIIAEYGDWTYGGTYSTTRVTREAENNSWHKGGDEGMLIQADNIQESVQTNQSLGADWLGASMYWDYADYAGFDDGVLTYCGVVDLCRIPKHSAYFYQSQRSADTDLSDYGIESGPMVYIANLWDDRADATVRIYSNCDTVELFLNGESLGEKGHDETIWGPHGDGDPMNYPGSTGKEISSDAIDNAPITFELDAYEPGELTAVGKIDGAEKASFTRKTPGSAAKIGLRPENQEALPLDGSSAKLVWIDILDSDGTVVTDAYTEVRLETEGPGLVVGPKTITTKAGQLAVWVKSKRGSGDITLLARAEGLADARITIPAAAADGLPEVPENGDADEYETAEEEPNIFLSKASRASTENKNGALQEIKENANDGSDSTKWCASSGSYPQWWEADLGSEYTIEDIHLSLETPGSVYYYTVSVSDEPMTDSDASDHIVVDHRQGSDAVDLAFDTPVKGRYVRITFTQDSNSEWAVLREVSGNGTSKNAALNKPVTASSENGTQKAALAVDGNADTFWCADRGTGNQWLQVDLKNPYQVSQVNLQFEKEDAAYQFVLQGSLDGVHYRDIKDFRNGEGLGQSVEIPADAVVQYVRVAQITTKNPETQWAAIREIEVFGDKTDYRLQNVAREKESFASSCADGGKPQDGNNGVPGWYWYPKDLKEAWWYVDLKGIYDLDNIQMTWNAQETHKYRIEISTDKKNWTQVVDKSREGNSEIQPYEQVSGTARYVRVILPAGRIGRQGFGLFGVYAPAPAQRTVSSLTEPAQIQSFTGVDFSSLPLPDEVEAVLSGNIRTFLPVSWSPEGYDKEKEGMVYLKGTLSEIAGVSVKEGQSVRIGINLLKNAEEEDAKKARAVTELIEAIGQVTYDAAVKERIDKARSAYNALTDKQKALVGNLAKLTAAETAYDALKTQNEAAKKLQKGKKYKSGKLYYTVLSETKRTVAAANSVKKTENTIKIPNTVKLKGITCTVTQISDNAFKNNRKLKNITVGKNVTHIGKNAFAGCKVLKKITVKSTKLKKAYASSLKGIAPNAVLDVPDKKVKNYKKLFGIKKNSKIKVK